MDTPLSTRTAILSVLMHDRSFGYELTGKGRRAALEQKRTVPGRLLRPVEAF